MKPTEAEDALLNPLLLALALIRETGSVAAAHKMIDEAADVWRSARRPREMDGSLLDGAISWDPPLPAEPLKPRA